MTEPRKPREVFVYYEDAVPAFVYSTEFPRPYEENGILFREVMEDEHSECTLTRAYKEGAESQSKIDQSKLDRTQRALEKAKDAINFLQLDLTAKFKNEAADRLKEIEAIERGEG